ncbi:MAG: damage-inducible protein CinA [Desulfuromonas sp.]|nr:MAG: damage-inducible protein CinA [Desulfuromonas sp.]
MKRIAVLAIGSELLDGRVSDTNTADIARILRRRGLQITESRCVGDDPEAIATQLQEMTRACDVLLVTGGLGPTDDDLTAAASAAAFNLPLEENRAALQLIEAFFQRSARPMHAANRKQALLPMGVTPLPNPSGSAPGFLLEQQGCQTYFLPGVPKEMRIMLQEGVLPGLAEAAPPLHQKTLKILGIAESHLQEKLRGVTFPGQIEPSFTLDYPLVLLTFEACGETAPELLEACATPVRTLLGNALVAEDEQTLPGVVATLLTEREVSLSLAESCTGGMVAELLTEVPGASRFLERGAVTYANSAKQDWLDVPEEALEQHGAVSEEVAHAMAIGIRQAATTDYALALTGIAGPDGGTAEKPVGTVYVALASRTGCTVEHLQLKGGRSQIRRAAAFRSLDLLRRRLLETE